MPVKDSQTEQQIKDAAKKLFFKEGRFKATTQEIADAAGVNRTLVNYYFRSRDQLFDLILQEARDKMDQRMNTTIDQEPDFRKKVGLFIDLFMEQSQDYPYLDAYMVTRMNDDVEKQNEVIAELRKTDKLKNFLRDIETEIKKGTVRDTEPVQFFLNMISLLTHPMAMQPLFKKILNYSDRQYRQVLAARKEVILKLLFV